MNKKIPIMLVSVIAMLALVFCSATTVLAKDYETTFTSPFTADVPTLDGNITAGEYADAKVVFWLFEPEAGHEDSEIYLYMMNTNDTIYIAFDLTWDDTIGDGDWLTVAFDQNDDGEFDFDTDAHDRELWIDLWRDGGDATSTPDVRYQAVWGFAESPNLDEYEHVIVEMAIPFASFNFEDETIVTGDTIGFYATGADTTSGDWVYPEDATDLWRGYELTDAEDWAQVTLGAYVAPPPPVVPEVAPANHAKDIGIVIAIVGIIVILGAVVFRDALGKNYWYLVALGIILALLGGANYALETVKTIPVIAP